MVESIQPSTTTNDRLASIEETLRQLLSIQQTRPIDAMPASEVLQVNIEDRALLDAYRNLPFSDFKKLHNRTMSERLKRMSHA